MEEQEPELKRRPEMLGSKLSLNADGNASNAGNQFFLYVPQELSNNSVFPFQPGTPLVLEVRRECLVIRVDEREKCRVPFLPPSSSTCWLRGTCRVSRDNMEQ